MAIPPVKPLVLLLLLVSCATVLGAGSQPPSPAPAKPQPPSHAPVHAPSHGPSPSPSHAPSPSPSHAPSPSPSHAPSPKPSIPKRSLVAVQGVVYCKPCELTGVETLLNATPLVGAVVKLQCNNTKNPQNLETKTDKNGYFFILAPKTISTYGVHKCKVTLGSSPQSTCTKPTNLHNGLQGATLVAQKQPSLSTPIPYQIFTVGPFAFEPPTKCAR